MLETVLVRVPRPCFFNVTEHRFEAQLDSVHVPEKVAMFSFFHLFDRDHAHVFLMLLKTFQERLRQYKIVSTTAGGSKTAALNLWRTSRAKESRHTY